MRFTSLRATAVASSVAAVMLLGIGARAQLVTVDLKDVTIQDVAKELEKQTGLHFQFVGSPKPLDWFIGAKVTSLHADNRPLKEVLRKACDETGYKYRRISPDTFWIEPGEIAPKPYAARVGEYEVSIKSVTVSGRNATFDFSNGIEAKSETAPGLYVNLTLEADTEDDAKLIHGFGDMTVVDSDGKEAQAPAEHNGAGDQLHFFPAPDSVDRTVHFDPPSPDATKIASLIGTLSLLQGIETEELRFDDLTSTNVTKTTAGVELVFEGAEIVLPTNRETATDGVVWRPEGHCTIRISTTGLGFGGPRAQDGRWAKADVYLLDKQGKEYRSNKTSINGSNNSMKEQYGFSVSADAELVAFVYRIERKLPGTRDLEFIIRDIPLPK